MTFDGMTSTVNMDDFAGNSKIMGISGLREVPVTEIDLEQIGFNCC